MTRRNLRKVQSRGQAYPWAGCRPGGRHLDHIEKVPTGNGLILPEEKGTAKHLGKPKIQLLQPISSGITGEQGVKVSV